MIEQKFVYLLRLLLLLLLRASMAGQSMSCQLGCSSG